MKSVTHGVLSMALMMFGGLAAAAPNDKAGDVKLAQTSDARCRKEVKDYLDTLRFVRQAAGEQIGDRVAGGYVSEAELGQLVSAQGHCAASQLLRDKRAIR